MRRLIFTFKIKFSQDTAHNYKTTVYETLCVLNDPPFYEPNVMVSSDNNYHSTSEVLLMKTYELRGQVNDLCLAPSEGLRSDWAPSQSEQSSMR